MALFNLANPVCSSLSSWLSETWTNLKADERRLNIGSIPHELQQILGIRWFHFVTNYEVTNATAYKYIYIHMLYANAFPPFTQPISRRRFGNPDCRLEATLGLWPREPTTTGSNSSPFYTTPGRGVDTSLDMEHVVDELTRHDISPGWRTGRPCRLWMQQIENDTGLNANDAWGIADNRKSWRAARYDPSPLAVV